MRVVHSSFLLVLLIAVVGCGRPTREFGAYAHYVAEFETESARFGRGVVVDDLIIKTGMLEPHISADCTTGTFMTPTIRLNERILGRVSDTTIKLALFHELGHCVLNRRHTTARRSNGRPASIMFPTNVFAPVFARDPEHYLKELFAGPFTRRTRTAVSGTADCALSL